MKKLFLLIFLVIFFSLPGNILAIYNPLSVPNNQFGIHIINENDLENAAKLVNSSGGDFGYVTLVITESERNVDRWNNIFNRMNSLHLIPIIRLATRLENDMWAKPNVFDAVNWTDFLSQLNWYTKNRYIVLFNEPNHAKEWGGVIDPMEYSDVVSSFSASLKESSDDFFILPAGFDASAPTGDITLDEVTFLKKMLVKNPSLFDRLDGWTSHSYPNPGFIGGVNNLGRGSLKTYIWELDTLKKLGVNKKLPVFITETGWPHNDNNYSNRYYYSIDKVAELIKLAGETVWNDKDNIAAVTPFILNYQSFPFSQFSWQKLNSSDYFPQFETYQNIIKTEGKPQLIIIPTITEKNVLGSVITANNQKEHDIKPSIIAKIFIFILNLFKK